MLRNLERVGSVFLLAVHWKDRGGLIGPFGSMDVSFQGKLSGEETRRFNNLGVETRLEDLLPLIFRFLLFCSAAKL